MKSRTIEAVAFALCEEICDWMKSREADRSKIHAIYRVARIMLLESSRHLSHETKGNYAEESALTFLDELKKTLERDGIGQGVREEMIKVFHSLLSTEPDPPRSGHVVEYPLTPDHAFKVRPTTAPDPIHNPVERAETTGYPPEGSLLNPIKLTAPDIIDAAKIKKVLFAVEGVTMGNFNIISAAKQFMQEARVRLTEDEEMLMVERLVDGYKEAGLELPAKIVVSYELKITGLIGDIHVKPKEQNG